MLDVLEMSQRDRRSKLHPEEHFVRVSYCSLLANTAQVLSLPSLGREMETCDMYLQCSGHSQI